MAQPLNFNFNPWAAQSKSQAPYYLAAPNENEQNQNTMAQMAAQAAPIAAPKEPQYSIKSLPQQMPDLPSEDPQQLIYDGSASSQMNNPMTQYLMQALMAPGGTSSPELEKQMKLADQSYSEAALRQAGEVQKQKDIYNQYANAERRTDFRPLAALSDSLLGSKLSATAESIAPESEQQKTLTLAGLQKGITDATQGLTKDQLEYIKQKLAQQSYIENRVSKEKLAKLAAAAAGSKTGVTTPYQESRLKMQMQRQVGAELRSFADKIVSSGQAPFIGRQLANINSADAAIAMANIIVPENAPEGYFPPKNETREQRIERLNSANPNQTAELIKNMDALLSRSNPTVHGQEVLAVPQTAQALWAKWESVLGNAPKGAKQGAFLDKMLDTIKRERNLSEQKYKSVIEPLKRMYPVAHKFYGEDMDKMAIAPLVSVDEYDEQNRQKTQQQSGPRPGDVVDGHVFKGGNPADPNSWGKQ